MRTLAWVLSVLVVSGCTSHVLIPPEQQQRLERDLTGKSRDGYLRLSYFVTPFFGDASKLLLTAVPPEEVRLLDTPDAQPINPGAVERILPAGARARILKVEFPSAWVVSERLVFTPRTQPWVYLAIEGAPNDKPFVVVLRSQIKSEDEFTAELERYVSRTNPTEVTAAWSEGVREAIRTKSIVVDMPADALEMAWGYPEQKRITYEGSVKKEDWSWPGGKRVAHLTDGRVAHFEGGGAVR